MALKFNVILGGDESDFAASQGWLDKFKSRHGIRQLDIQGEKMSANISAADAFVKEFSEKLQKEDYDLDLIYNADETGLCWKSLPFKTLASNREKAASGYKSSKDRVTLLACANASGTHRIPLLLIGKLKNPRCFQNIQIPLVYKNQSEGWMNREVFTDWYDNTFIPEVKMYQEKVNKVGKSVLLVLDSAPSHPDAEGLTRNGFRVLFLPPNVSSIIQPMDQGLIETMKRNYRKQLLSRLLFRDIEQEDCEHKKEQAESVSTFFKSIDLKDCCYMVVEAWNSISPLTLKCAWNKLLYYYYEERYYLANPPIQSDNEEINTTDTLVTQTLETLDSLGLRGDCDSEDVLKWLESDKLDQGYPILSEEEIVKSVLTNNTNDEENDVEDMEPTSSLGPSATEAIKAFDVAFSWLEMQEEVEVVQLLQLRKMREMAIAKKLAESKQTYFTQNYGLL
ncbi:hypothetical protein M8J77_011767 [Diaphorina citri]|nr:hypothetical protein M8J77_011767 [Diaphorina citri]